ncbi:MAG: phosphatase PAP2 family protein [Acidobacteriaceae bacterium]
MFVRGFVLLVAALVPPFLHGQVQRQRDECDLGALEVCGKHVLQDEGAILTSPFHARVTDLLWIAPVGLATGVAIDYDAHAIRSLGSHPQREKDFRHVSDVGVYLPFAGVVAGYAVGALHRDDYLKQTAVIAGEAIADSLILNEGLKYAINRETPSQGDGTGRFWPHGTKTWPDGQSMPSNHSIITWSFAHVVANRYPGFGTRLAVYGLASTVSLSRVLAKEHFPSDVLVGSTLGYLIGGYVVNKRGEPSRSYSFSMVDTPNGRGFQLSYNFNH